MPKQFTAEDGTKMAFEMVKKILGCQQFEITIEGQPPPSPRSITLAGLDTEAHYKTLEILLAWGMPHFERLPML